MKRRQARSGGSPALSGCAKVRMKVSGKEAAIAFFLLVNAAIIATLLAIFTRIATRTWGLNPALAYLPFLFVFGSLLFALIMVKYIMSKKG